jgi:hypothetical protein
MLQCYVCSNKVHLKLNRTIWKLRPSFIAGFKNWPRFANLSGFAGDETDGKFLRVRLWKDIHFRDSTYNQRQNEPILLQIMGYYSLIIFTCNVNYPSKTAGNCQRLNKQRRLIWIGNIQKKLNLPVYVYNTWFRSRPLLHHVSISNRKAASFWQTVFEILVQDISDFYLNLLALELYI